MEYTDYDDEYVELKELMGAKNIIRIKYLGCCSNYEYYEYRIKYEE